MNNFHTTKSIPPLLRRTQLLPGESLSSLLERLAQLNYYPSLSVLHLICREHLDLPANRDDLARPRWHETFLQLADLTHIAPEVLYSASNHRFAPLLSPPSQLLVEFPWAGSASKVMLTFNLAYGRLRPASAAQYCPRCLQMTAYHRLSWTPISAAICLEHRCLLMSQCPNCSKRLSIHEIIRKQCRACQTDLSIAKPLYVEENELGCLSQQAIQFWLAVDTVDQLSDKYKPPPYHPSILYRFLEELSRRLLIRRKDWPILPAPLDELSEHIAFSPDKRPQLKNLTPEGIFHLHRAAFTGVMNWPNGLFQFLDAYRGCSSPCQNQINLDKPLNSIRINWFQSDWRNPDFEFMQQSFIKYLLARNLPLPVALVEQFKNVTWFVEQTGLCSGQNAGPILDVSSQELHQFLLRGLLNSCLWSHSRSKVPIFERDKLLTLKANWKLGWSVQEASAWLGISIQDVIELVEQDELAVVDRPNTHAEYWLLSRQSVEDFFKKVTSQLSLFEGNKDDILRLGAVVGYIGYLGIHRAALLQCVADGFLPGLKLESEIHSLNHVHFQENFVINFPDLFYAKHGKVTGNMFARENGFPVRLVRDWMKAGLIKSEMNLGIDGYFLRSRLEQLAAEYVPELG
jgi:hypothetical protein